METVEMDLMQAQIGSLATDVSRLEAKVAKGGSNKIALINDIDMTGVGTFTAKSSLTSGEIQALISSGNFVAVICDLSTILGNDNIFQSYITEIKTYNDNFQARGYIMSAFSGTSISTLITYTIDTDGNVTGTIQ